LRRLERKVKERKYFENSIESASSRESVGTDKGKSDEVAPLRRKGSEIERISSIRRRIDYNFDSCCDMKPVGVEASIVNSSMIEESKLTCSNEDKTA